MKEHKDMWPFRDELYFSEWTKKRTSLTLVLRETIDAMNRPVWTCRPTQQHGVQGSNPDLAGWLPFHPKLPFPLCFVLPDSLSSVSSFFVKNLFNKTWGVYYICKTLRTSQTCSHIVLIKIV